MGSTLAFCFSSVVGWFSFVVVVIVVEVWDLSLGFGGLFVSLFFEIGSLHNPGYVDHADLVLGIQGVQLLWLHE